ncbi:MAG: PDZ domain-containing protein [Ruminococcus sp.]|nr:PDZ domain-containing protein [Ruminococcus sp.]
MNYFDKELENVSCEKNSEIPKELLWFEATSRKKGSPAYMWFVYLLMVCVLIGCFYMLSCTIFGFGWLKNAFEKDKPHGEDFQYVLPLADKPKLEGDGLYTGDGRYTVAGIAQLMKKSAVTVVVYDESTTKSVGQGSGFIFSEDGYIITNAHVVQNGDVSCVNVYLWDDTLYNGKIIGVDPITDIAVLKIQALGLTPVTFGNSNQLLQGEDVVAFGNPAGLEASITAGVVSAVGRYVALGDMSLYDCIQVDAAINPGNSGGALLNMWGQVVGVVSAKLESEQYDGIGFAVSTAEAKPVIESIIEHGCVLGRVKIGIEFYEVSEEDAQKSELLVAGLFVVKIDPECDIFNSGLKAGDIITSVNGKKVLTAGDVALAVKDNKPGDKVKFAYWRENKEHTSEFRLMEAPTYKVVDLAK